MKISMKRVQALVLAAVLSTSLAIPAFAAETGSTDNFQKTAAYSGQFQDVPDSHWATDSVKTCYEYGLMKGVGAGFNPGGTLTVAEALVMADRVHEIYTTGTSTLQNGTPWYQPYVDYALEQGIIRSDDFDSYTAKATRAEMAYIFCHSLPDSALAAVNDVTSLPDVNASTAHSSEIFALYNAGVLTGSDAYGACKPDTTITRAEAAAIIARVAIPGQRRAVTLLSDFDLPNGLVLALPQDMKLTEEDGAISGFSSTMMAAIFSENDESYRGASISVLSESDISGVISDAADSAELTISEIKSTLTAFGSVSAYRTTCTATISGMPCDGVIYSYISGDAMVMAFLFCVDNSDGILQTVANNVRVNGSTVQEKL